MDKKELEFIELISTAIQITITGLQELQLIIAEYLKKERLKNG